MKLKAILFIGLALSFYQVKAQEQLGLKISNYSGVNSFALNPAWAVGGPLGWDVNIVSLGVFIEQDYTYGQNGSLIKVLKNGAEFITDETATDGTSTTTAVPFYFQEKSNYDVHHNAFVMAPSFMANIKGHTVGLTLQARTWLSGYNIDGDLGYANVSDTMIYVGEIDPFQVGAMAWGEIGLNYGRNIISNKNMQVNVGGSLKFLLGYEATNISNNSATGVSRANDAITVDPADISISYASNYTNDGGYGFQRNGFGISSDVGVTFVKLNPKQDKQHYKWKLGVSLLDVGRVVYGKNANDYSFVSSDVSTFAGDAFENIQDANGVIDAINANANTSSAQLTDTKFNMWTPMALSVQFDAPLIDRLYVSGTAVLGMRFKGAAIERSDIIAVTPRFETKWFEWGIPLSLYRWNDFNMGTYLRMGPLTIGTESLNNLVIPSQFEGADVYLSLKVNSAMFKKQSKNRGKGSGCWSNKF